MPAITESEHPRTPYFAADGPFHLGEPMAFDVVDRDFPTEYSAVEYVAAATLGQPIAVGHLHFGVPDGPNAVTCFEIGLAIIPGRGIWLLVPVFKTWDSAIASAEQSRDVLRNVFGERIDALPIETAYVPVLGRVPPTPPPGLDPSTIYDPSLFDAVATNLRPRPGVDASEIDRSIADLLEIGYWIDVKRTSVESLMGALPRWLAERLPGTSDPDGHSPPCSKVGIGGGEGPWTVPTRDEVRKSGR
jgi:hypothetical protein